jgi:hypothetical protein
MRDARRGTALLLGVAALVAACGGGAAHGGGAAQGASRAAHGASRAARIEPPRSASPPSGDENALRIAPMVLSAPESAEALMVLDADGTVHHRDCSFLLRPDGRIVATGSAPSLRVRQGQIGLESPWRPLFELAPPRLLRADGRAAVIEEDRVRFEGSDLELRVHGPSGPGLDATALVLVAALSICGD